MNLSIISIGIISLNIYYLLSAIKIRKGFLFTDLAGEFSPSEEEKDLALFYLIIRFAIELRSR